MNNRKKRLLILLPGGQPHILRLPGVRMPFREAPLEFAGFGSISITGNNIENIFQSTYKD